MGYFLYGVPTSCGTTSPRHADLVPARRESCTSAYYSDRRLGVSETVCTAASTIHFFTGNNIGARGRPGLAQPQYPPRRRPGRPRERPFKHPNPIGWTENNRAEPGGALHHPAWQPQLKGRAMRKARPGLRCGGAWLALRSSTPPSSPGMSSTSRISITQEEDDEESASLADVLGVLVKTGQAISRRTMWLR